MGLAWAGRGARRRRCRDIGDDKRRRDAPQPPSAHRVTAAAVTRPHLLLGQAPKHMGEFFPGKTSDFHRFVARRPSSAQREILGRTIQSAGQKLQKVSIGTVSLGWGVGVSRWLTRTERAAHSLPVWLRFCQPNCSGEPPASPYVASLQGPMHNPN